MNVFKTLFFQINQLSTDSNLFTLYIAELIKEFKFQFGVMLKGNQLYNWKWFAFVFIFAVVIYSIRLKSVRRVFKRIYRFSIQKRVRLEFYKDLKFFVLKSFYKPLVIVLFGFNVHQLSKYFRKLLNSYDLDIPVLFHMDPHFGPAFKMIMVMIVIDFAFYITHYYEHKFEELWAFHKIHHRATNLNPFTKLRIHPLLYFYSYAGMALIGTPILFVLTSFYSIPNDKPLYFYTLGAIFINNSLTHLRHSHVKIHFGIFSYIFISPVMHQVHHSMLEKHHDKNFATLFSFWDLMFGTFYLPAKNEVFKFGIKEDRNKIPTMMEELFYLPFNDIKNKYKRNNNLEAKEKELSVAAQSPHPSSVTINKARQSS